MLKSKHFGLLSAIVLHICQPKQLHLLMPGVTEHQIFQYLLSFVSENKQAVFDKTAALRTRHITLLLEDVYQPHNASAVLRSCDCFGLQDLHIIEINNRYRVNPNVVRGAAKWIDLHRYTDRQAAADTLKNAGYRLVGTSPRAGRPIGQLPLSQKTALVFGTELTGISPELEQFIDDYVYIPMYGFTESFNISVSAALCLYETVNRLHASDLPWQLSEAEQLALKMKWVRRAVKHSDQLVKQFIASQA